MMGASLCYFVEGEREFGILENISELGEPKSVGLKEVQKIPRLYQYLYGISLPEEDVIPRVDSLYEKLRRTKYSRPVNLFDSQCFNEITRVTRDLLVHFEEIKEAYIISLEGLKRVYYRLDGLEKRTLKETLEKLKSYEKNGYKNVKIVFYIEP